QLRAASAQQRERGIGRQNGICQVDQGLPGECAVRNERRTLAQTICWACRLFDGDNQRWQIGVDAWFDHTDQGWRRSQAEIAQAVLERVQQRPLDHPRTLFSGSRRFAACPTVVRRFWAAGGSGASISPSLGKAIGRDRKS